MVSQADRRQPSLRKMLDTFDIRKCNPRRAAAAAAARSNDATKLNLVHMDESGRDSNGANLLAGITFLH